MHVSSYVNLDLCFLDRMTFSLVFYVPGNLSVDLKSPTTSRTSISAVDFDFVSGKTNHR